MSSKTIYHYVYRITNLIKNKHYYGSRKSKIEPKYDLGIKYFSSSMDKNFKKMIRRITLTTIDIK